MVKGVTQALSEASLHHLHLLRQPHTDILESVSFQNSRQEVGQQPLLLSEPLAHLRVLISYTTLSLKEDKEQGPVQHSHSWLALKIFLEFLPQLSLTEFKVLDLQVEKQTKITQLWHFSCGTMSPAQSLVYNINSAPPCTGFYSFYQLNFLDFSETVSSPKWFIKVLWLQNIVSTVDFKKEMKIGAK